MRRTPNERENMTEGVRKHAAANWTITTNDARESFRTQQLANALVHFILATPSREMQKSRLKSESKNVYWIFMPCATDWSQLQEESICWEGYEIWPVEENEESKIFTTINIYGTNLKANSSIQKGQQSLATGKIRNSYGLVLATIRDDSYNPRPPSVFLC